MFRPVSVQIIGPVTLHCIGSNRERWEIVDLDFRFTWKDRIDANPSAGDAGILEGVILPKIEAITGNAYDITIRWRNDRKMEERHGYTNIDGMRFERATGPLRNTPRHGIPRL